MRFAVFTLSLAFFLVGCAASQFSQSSQQPVSNAALSIFPGTTTYAEATVNSDGSITLTKVETVTNPSITIKFNFTESGKGMMLSVENPLDRTIKYHLDMIDYEGNPHNTSSCPVEAGLSVFEFWPHPIPEIRVSNTHVARKNEEGICKY